MSGWRSIFGLKRKPADGFRFRSENCDSLVFYAVCDEEAEPEASISQLVFPAEESRTLEDFFLADNAPYLTALERKDFVGELERAQAQAKDHFRGHKLLQRVQTWLNGHDERWILYQLEPAQIAGDGTARSRALADQ